VIINAETCINHLAAADVFASPVHVSPSRPPYVLVLPDVFEGHQLPKSAPMMCKRLVVVVRQLAQLWRAEVVALHSATANSQTYYTPLSVELIFSKHTKSHKQKYLPQLTYN